MMLKAKRWTWGMTLLFTAALQGCGEEQSTNTQQTSQKLEPPITIKHELGTTVLTHRPQRVAALDMNEVDFLDQLNIPVTGMAKDYIPHYLAKYKDDTSVKDLGAIVQPNMEKVHLLKPDLILMTPLHTTHYQELLDIAPTLYFDTSFNNLIPKVKEHLLTLGRIFDKEALAKKKAAELDKKVQTIQKLTTNRSEKALVILHNNGAFRNFGVQSRYGFVFNELGVKSASTIAETALHGQPISSEFIQQADPDIIYIVDRTAVMERRPTINADEVSNPLLRQTKAWKNGHVVFVDADAWYIAAASPTSIDIMIDDIKKGYQ